MTETQTHDEYLGDGVYASTDGYHIWLDLRAQPPVTPITRIGLEPGVFARLADYERRLRQMYNEQSEAADRAMT